VACAAILNQDDGARPGTTNLYSGALEQERAAEDARPPRPDPEAAQYAALQASIPPGAGVLTMLDRAYWLDFRRNKIDAIDLPGMVSPRPGLPLDSDDAFVAYLLDHQLRYFAFVRKESSIELYRNATWVSLSRNPDPSQRILAPLFFKAFERADSLARTRTKVFERDGMVVVDLATPAGHPPAP
jgi:hypothetical protein